MMRFSTVRRVAGWLLHGAIGAMILMAGSGKAFGFAPPEIREALAKYGLGDRMHLLGYGELITAVLLLIPRTMPIGAMLTCGFWGGVICIHMAHGEPFWKWAGVMALTGLGASLRDPRVFASLAGPAKTPGPSTIQGGDR